MCVLAHIFESAGIATVALVSMLPVAEKVAPPRALHGEFPLGRPLAKPGDAGLQHDVIAHAFALLEAPSGPVLKSHPVVIPDTSDAVSCRLPPAFYGDDSPAVLEAKGIRKAYDRIRGHRGVTSVGRVIDADGVPGAVAVLEEIAAGAGFKDVELPGRNTIAVCHDIRTYYEEAAVEPADGPIAAGRAIENWFFEQTEAGRVVLAARKSMAEQEAPFPFWFYMAPGHR